MKNFWYTVLGIGLGIAGTIAFDKREKISKVVGDACKAGKNMFNSCDCGCKKENDIATEETPTE